MAWRIERVGVVGSTNDEARERVLAGWARGEVVEGIAVVAEKQRTGRGQHGRVWESPAGGLYLSAVVERVPQDVRGVMALLAGAAAAAAVGRALSETEKPVWLRWPNDVMVGEKKVGGILCESVAMGERWAGIIGVGINVSTDVETFVEGLRGRATSLVAEGSGAAVDAMLATLLEEIEAGASRAVSVGVAGIVAAAQAWDGLTGRLVEIETDGRRILGTAAGIAATGGLRIDVDGRQHTIYIGTILRVDGVAVRG